MFWISEIAIILIVVILIFGAKKLPELARSMGKSARILKSEAKAMKSDQNPTGTRVASSPEVTAPRIIRAAPGAGQRRTTALTSPHSTRPGRIHPPRHTESVGRAWPRSSVTAERTDDDRSSTYELVDVSIRA